MEYLMDWRSDILQLFTTHWITLLLGLLILGFFIYWYGTKASRRLQAEFPGIPGPKPLPFVGHIFEIIKLTNGIHFFFDKYYKKYGKLYSLWFFDKPSLVVSDPEMLKAIMVKNFDCFQDRPVPFDIPEPMDSFLSIAKGSRWKRIRNTLSPTFSAHKMKLVVPLMNMSCDTLLKKIDKAAETKESFDIVKYQQAVTLEIILSAVFGVQSECQTDPNDPVMARAIHAMQPGRIRQFIFRVLLPLLPFGSKISGTEASARFLFSSMYDLGSFTKKLINARKESGQTRKDMLDLMLNAANPDNESQKKLSDDEVVAQCIIFLLAGYETTSTTLALVCHHLATNPDVQEKLQQEIDSVWTDEDKMPSYDTVYELPYLKMVISETLRLYPPGFMLTRTCVKDCVIEGIKIPKETPIEIPVYSIHRDPKNYPDPEKFDPERFNTEAKQSRDPYTYLPFGHGPRNCIGMRFAQMEMKLVLARILKRFHIKATSKTKIPPETGVKNTLSVIGAINIGVQRRENTS